MSAERRPFGGKTAEGNKRSSPANPVCSFFSDKGQSRRSRDRRISVDTEGFLNNLAREDFLNDSFREEQLLEFGLKSPKDLESLPLEIKKRNLIFGMKLYYLLRPLFE